VEGGASRAKAGKKTKKNKGGKQSVGSEEGLTDGVDFLVNKRRRAGEREVTEWRGRKGKGTKEGINLTSALSTRGEA